VTIREFIIVVTYNAETGFKSILATKAVASADTVYQAVAGTHGGIGKQD
jgi:hypothetical protein